MKKIFYTIAMMGVITLISSCGNEEHKEDTHATSTKHEEHKEICSFSIDPSTTQLEWTSYKHDEKTPVGGVFDMMELSNTIISETPVETFKNATISINTRSVNSKNEVRDEKIKNSFFGTMDKTDFLTGKIVSLEGKKTEMLLLQLQ